MPFKKPIEVDNAAYGNAEQPTINIGNVAGSLNVQGGGALLLHETGTIPSDTSISFEVEGPASGLTYFGVGIIVSITASSVDIPIRVYVYNYGFGIGSPTSAQIILAGGGDPLNLTSFGIPSRASFAVPMGTDFPLRIDLDNPPGGIQHYEISVIGLSAADTVPRDFGQWTNGLEDRKVWTSTAAGAYAQIASSMETRQYLLTGVSATAGGSFVVEAVQSDGTWVTTQNRAHNSYYGNVVPAANIATNGNSLITIPGDGFIHRITCINALTGSVTLSYLGRIT